MPVPWLVTPEGLSIRVKANPKASRSAIKGVVELPDGPALAVAVTAPPVDGAANAALLAFIAKTLGVAKGAALLEAGDASRIKRVLIRGDGAVLAERLTALMACSAR
ncbi:DUF167 domain-containing protein [Sphingomonas lacunae]|uniref:UPF0235 protein GV829_05560 n=1 Tax=Sphingomonas lacunae TaxID=2698828 RepID=A0A6M4AWV2_9SPHN|nr:DUF167 domain-containing protein [Sphingomonas lacunae]